MLLFCLDIAQKKRGQLLRLRYSRYRQTPLHHIRVKAHAIGVSILAFTLGAILNLAIYE